VNEPVEGSWRPRFEAKRIAYPAGAYALTPKDADPNAEDWLSKNWDADSVAPPNCCKPSFRETAGVKLGYVDRATKALLATDNTSA